MNSVFELFIFKQLESIQTFISYAQFSRSLRVMVSADVSLAESDSLIAWSSAYPCSDISFIELYTYIPNDSSIVGSMRPAQLPEVHFQLTSHSTYLLTYIYIVMTPTLSFLLTTFWKTSSQKLLHWLLWVNILMTAQGSGENLCLP